jgi:ubiquinone/menaquinone biosynthesis C-methylase UbiE
MPSFFQFLPLLLSQQAGRQQLPRTPEPTLLTEAADNVVQYDRVMTTKLVIAYAGGLEVIHRARAETAGGTAFDLACGPGHYTLCLSRYLGYDQVVGIDLSAPMVEIARQNAEKQGVPDRVQFRVGDVSRLEDVASETAALASFTDAAHHMPDLGVVRQVLQEMDRITRPDGLVMLMDLVRLRTAGLTERYVNLLGQDYVQRGLPQFFDDFHHSMYAAWTASELRQAIPRQTRRWWCHLVPRGLPTVQVILGLPVGRERVFVRSGLPWTEDKNPVPADMRSEWKLMRMTLFWGSCALLPPDAS